MVRTESLSPRGKSLPPTRCCCRTSAWALGAQEPCPEPTLPGHMLTGASSSVKSGSTASEDSRAGSFRSWSRQPKRMNLSLSLPVQGSSRVLYTTLPAVLRLSKIATCETERKPLEVSKEWSVIVVPIFFQGGGKKESSEASNKLKHRYARV